MIEEIIAYARAAGASDIHYTKGEPLVLRVDGEILPAERPFELELFEQEILSHLSDEERDAFCQGQDMDLAIQAGGTRCRVNLYHKMGKAACVLRLLAERIPSPEELGLPPLLPQLAMLPRGLVLITGPTGSGKSTTLASMLDYANTRRPAHIITIEDPVEYLHHSKRSIISQREVGRDTGSFVSALRSTLREDPDIILVGEMRDYETISAALTAAETGHLVLSTLHTSGAAKSIDRIIDVFPPHQQPQVRTQLAGVLQGVVTQQLLRKKGGGRVAAFEILRASSGILNMIREGKTHQITSAMQTGGREGMVLMDRSLAELVRRGEVALEEAQAHCFSPSELNSFLGHY